MADLPGCQEGAARGARLMGALRPRQPEESEEEREPEGVRAEVLGRRTRARPRPPAGRGWGGRRSPRARRGWPVLHARPEVV